MTGVKQLHRQSSSPRPRHLVWQEWQVASLSFLPLVDRRSEYILQSWTRNNSWAELKLLSATHSAPAVGSGNSIPLSLGYPVGFAAFAHPPYIFLQPCQRLFPLRPQPLDQAADGLKRPGLSSCFQRLFSFSVPQFPGDDDAASAASKPASRITYNLMSNQHRST